MYAIPNVSRVYITSFFLLCSSFLFAPKVNAIYTWQDARNDFEILKRDTNDAYRDLVKRPANSSLSTASSPATVAKNPAGGLSVSTNQILKDMGRSTNLTSTSNFSLNSAKNALKSCVRSPSCAGRTLGGGAIIYDGIHAWKDVYDILTDDNDTPVQRVPKPVPPSNPQGATCLSNGIYFPSCNDALAYRESQICPAENLCPLTLVPYSSGTGFNIVGVEGQHMGSASLIANSCPSGSSNSASGCLSNTEFENKPVPLADLDQMIDEGYDPEPSDAPALFAESPASSTILRDPESVTLSTPAPIQLPSTTTTSTNSAGQTITKVTNQTLTYEVTNNDTKSPSINSSLMTTTNTYDSSGNLTETETSTKNEQGFQHEAPAPSAPLELDFELPPFCTWASIVCDWIGWTKEPLDEEEPDLSQLITVFEPDEDGFDLGIGSGSCPAPIQLNLGIINKTVEVKYNPFCDFLEMIRPFVLAAAYLFAAYLYVGVLRRG